MPYQAMPGGVRQRCERSEGHWFDTKAAAAAVVIVFALARLYLAVDHPDDALVGRAPTGAAAPRTWT